MCANHSAKARLQQADQSPEATCDALAWMHDQGWIVSVQWDGQAYSWAWTDLGRALMLVYGFILPGEELIDRLRVEWP